MHNLQKLLAATVLFFGLFLSSQTAFSADAAPGSKFSKLKLEMGTNQIYDLIGSPTDTRTYETGKRWIPYYHGSDSRRTELIYKGEGRLTIGGNGRLIKITVDTKEDGYK